MHLRRVYRGSFAVNEVLIDGIKVLLERVLERAITVSCMDPATIHPFDAVTGEY